MKTTDSDNQSSSVRIEEICSVLETECFDDDAAWLRQFAARAAPAPAAPAACDHRTGSGNLNADGSGEQRCDKCGFTTRWGPRQAAPSQPNGKEPLPITVTNGNSVTQPNGNEHPNGEWAWEQIKTVAAKHRQFGPAYQGFNLLQDIFDWLESRDGKEQDERVRTIRECAGVAMRACMSLNMENCGAAAAVAQHAILELLASPPATAGAQK